METTNRIDKATPLTVEDFPHEIEVPKIEAGSDQITRYVVKQRWYDADADEYWEQNFTNPQQQYAFRHQVLNNPPKTVGNLMYAWITAINNYALKEASMTALISGLEEINAEMNKYAEFNNLCGEYEEKLYLFNDMLHKAGYRGFFRFEGREKDVTVTVQRKRTVMETIDVTVSMVRGDTEGAYEAAIEIASESDDELWTVIHENYLTDDYEAIDYYDC